MGISLLDQLRVEERAVFKEQIDQRPAVFVLLLPIELDADLLSFQHLLREPGVLFTEILDRLLGMNSFRSIDADQRARPIFLKNFRKADKDCHDFLIQLLCWHSIQTPSQQA